MLLILIVKRFRAHSTRQMFSTHVFVNISKKSGCVVAVITVEPGLIIRAPRGHAKLSVLTDVRFMRVNFRENV